MDIHLASPGRVANHGRDQVSQHLAEAVHIGDDRQRLVRNLYRELVERGRVGECLGYGQNDFAQVEPPRLQVEVAGLKPRQSPRSSTSRSIVAEARRTSAATSGNSSIGNGRAPSAISSAYPWMRLRGVRSS